MNIVVWVVQVVLAVFALSGGLYKLFAWEQLSAVPAVATMPRAAWTFAGILEVVLALLLLLPIVWKPSSAVVPLAAGVLAIESLALAVLYARHSTRMEPSNPMLWVVLMAVLAAIVALARMDR